MNKIFADLKLLKIDLLSMIIYYPCVRVVYSLSRIFPILTPNVITLLGLIHFLTASSAFLVTDDIRYLALGLFIFSIMDVADGFVARKKGLSSKVGEILDISVDRVVFLLLCCLTSYYLVFWNESIEHSLGFGIYVFLFLYLDSIILIVTTLKARLKPNFVPKRTVSNFSIFLNNQFRFSSYMFLCLWMLEKNFLYLMVALTLVVMEYLILLLKFVRFLMRRM